MTLSPRDMECLRDSGFLASEIMEFHIATTPSGEPQPRPDLNQPPWSDMMKSRRDWIDDKVKRGWSQDEIINEIGKYYRNPKATPWDFLRAEYRGKRKRVDFLTGMKNRGKLMTRKLYGT